MDILDKILSEHGSLNGLYYILRENAIILDDVGLVRSDRSLSYPELETSAPAPVVNEADVIADYTVQAYQSVLDVCVQVYGSLNKLIMFLVDNDLVIDDYLNVNQKLKIRRDDNKNKVSNTLFALNATIANYDKVIPNDKDIYLGTEDGDYIGITMRVKIKLN